MSVPTEWNMCTYPSSWNPLPNWLWSNNLKWPFSSWLDCSENGRFWLTIWAYLVKMSHTTVLWGNQQDSDHLSLFDKIIVQSKLRNKNQWYYRPSHTSSPPFLSWKVSLNLTPRFVPDRMTSNIVRLHLKWDIFTSKLRVSFINIYRQSTLPSASHSDNYCIVIMMAILIMTPQI